MKVFYSSRYEVSLPGHVWPTSKYRLIADRLSGRVAMVEPIEASWDDLALVHTGEYLDKLRANTLTAADMPYDAGILYRPPENVVREFPQFPVTRDYDELRAAFEHAAGELS